MRCRQSLVLMKSKYARAVFSRECVLAHSTASPLIGVMCANDHTPTQTYIAPNTLFMQRRKAYARNAFSVIINREPNKVPPSPPHAFPWAQCITMRYKFSVPEELICCENRIAVISRQANPSDILLQRRESSRRFARWPSIWIRFSQRINPSRTEILYLTISHQVYAMA